MFLTVRKHFLIFSLNFPFLKFILFTPILRQTSPWTTSPPQSSDPFWTLSFWTRLWIQFCCSFNSCWVAPISISESLRLISALLFTTLWGKTCFFKALIFQDSWVPQSQRYFDIHKWLLMALSILGLMEKLCTNCLWMKELTENSPYNCDRPLNVRACLTNTNWSLWFCCGCGLFITLGCLGRSWRLDDPFLPPYSEEEKKTQGQAAHVFNWWPNEWPNSVGLLCWLSPDINCPDAFS